MLLQKSKALFVDDGKRTNPFGAVVKVKNLLSNKFL